MKIHDKATPVTTHERALLLILTNQADCARAAEQSARFLADRAVINLANFVETLIRSRGLDPKEWMISNDAAQFERIPQKQEKVSEENLQEAHHA